MSDSPQPPGWYYAQGDPPDTQRYWDGTQWQGGPQPVPAAGQAGPGMVGAGGGAAMDLAEPINRIAGRFVDWILWFIVSMIVSAVVAGAGSFTGNGDVAYIRLFLAGLINLIAVVAYEVVMPVQAGGTIGKMLLGTKIVKEDGSPVDYQVAGMRIGIYAAIALLGALIPFIGIITFPIAVLIGIASTVMLFTDDRRRAVWDMVAKTVVVKR